jgi:hypothetical protein
LSPPKLALVPVVLLANYVFIAPFVAIANAVMVNPSSLLAFCIVAFCAAVVDAGVVALLLAFRGVAALPVFVAYFVPNGGFPVPVPAAPLDCARYAPD